MNSCTYGSMYKNCCMYKYKYKFGMGASKLRNNDKEKSSKGASKESKEPKELESLKLENEVLSKNNKVLAQKVADLEHSRIL